MRHCCMSKRAGGRGGRCDVVGQSNEQEMVIDATSLDVQMRRRVRRWWMRHRWTFKRAGGSGRCNVVGHSNELEGGSGRSGVVGRPSVQKGEVVVDATSLDVQIHRREVVDATSLDVQMSRRWWSMRHRWMSKRAGGR
jgi:hypothetical protein